MLEAKDFYWLIEYIGYSNFILFIVLLYIAYYLLSNTFMFVMFLGIGIVIGVYISYATRNMYGMNLM
jgi:multisubunit Na+/H+ antiporter MnhE subunit